MSRRVSKSEQVGGENENYGTPGWTVDRLLDDVHLPAGRWLEPCAGEGSIIKAVNRRVEDVTWTGTEIRPCRKDLLYAMTGSEAIGSPFPHTAVIGDFLELAQTPERLTFDDKRRRWAFDVVITNPPYSLAEEFIRAARQLAPIVVMLLRINYLASAKRQAQHREDLPEQIWILPDRPKFVLGASDSCEYGWFIWSPTKTPEARVRILRATPLEERKLFEQRPFDPCKAVFRYLERHAFASEDEICQHLAARMPDGWEIERNLLSNMRERGEIETEGFISKDGGEVAFPGTTPFQKAYGESVYRLSAERWLQIWKEKA